MSAGHYLVDLDGTLAQCEPGASWDGESIGEPVPLMVQTVRRWLAEGKDVRIFTARVSSSTHSLDFIKHQLELIAEWTYNYIGVALPAQCWKDFETLVIYDDRCRQVILNTGEIVGEGA